MLKAADTNNARTFKKVDKEILGFIYTHLDEG